MEGDKVPDRPPELFCTPLISSRRHEISQKPTCNSALSAFEGRERRGTFSFLRVRLADTLASFAANRVSEQSLDFDSGKRSLSHEPVLLPKHRTHPMIHVFPDH